MPRGASVTKRWNIVSRIRSASSLSSELTIGRSSIILCQNGSGSASETSSLALNARRIGCRSKAVIESTIGSRMRRILEQVVVIQRKEKKLHQPDLLLEILIPC